MGKRVIGLDPVPPNTDWLLRFPLTRPNPTTADEEPVLRAYLTGTFSWEVYKQASDGTYPSVATTSGTFVITAVLQDSYKTGDTWDQGEPGFNFEATMPAASFASKDTQYKVRIGYTFSAGGSFAEWFTIRTLNVP